MKQILLHLGEIGLKGKNRSDFEKQLQKNINQLSKKQNLELEVKRIHRKILIYSKEDEKKLTYFLKKIFGIKSFSFIESIKKDEKELFLKVEEIIKEFKEKNIKSISIKTKRSDKTFPIKSPQVNTKVGDIAKKYDIKIDYKNAKNTIYIEIRNDKIYTYYNKIKGPEGLPVGSAGGRVLCLLSGGIDSPVAANLLMKRGCTVDFIHFHSFANNQIAFKTKITKTVEKLNEFQNSSSLVMIPNTIYEILTGGKMQSRYELIFFKYYLLNFACKYAKENHYDAIVTGDNLAQVASQTLQNLKTTSIDVDIPIFRPLLCFEKEEIINLAKEIGTFDLAIQEYKDCCSLLAKNPATKARIDKFRKYLENIDLDELFIQTNKSLERKKIN